MVQGLGVYGMGILGSRVHGFISGRLGEGIGSLLGSEFVWGAQRLCSSSSKVVYRHS